MKKASDCNPPVEKACIPRLLEMYDNVETNGRLLYRKKRRAGYEVGEAIRPESAGDRKYEGSSQVPLNEMSKAVQWSACTCRGARFLACAGQACYGVREGL